MMMRLCPFLLRQRSASSPLCLVVLLTAFSATPAYTQSADKTAPTAQKAPALAYDVATIKPSHTEDLSNGIGISNDVLQANNVSMLELLPFACDVRRRQISGLPPWAEHQRYDISAKILDATPEQVQNLSQDQTRALLLGLLEQRFGLKWHNTTEVVSDYELRIAKGGSKLTPTKNDDQSRNMDVNNTDISAKGVTLANLADTLSNQVDRPVVDKTGLSGRFDLHLKWSREEAKTEAAGNGTDTDAPPPMFTAIEEQLGLRLQPGKDPVRTLVIDQLTPPTEN